MMLRLIGAVVFFGLLSAMPIGAVEPPAVAPTAPAPVAPTPQTPAAAEQPRQLAKDGIPGAAYQRPAFPVEPGLADPTRISESFRDALERRMPKQAAPVGGAASGPTPRAALPDISLAAKVCGHHEDMMHAMLRIDGKVELVQPGDKLTVIAHGGVTEIQVLDIQRDHVHVRVITGTDNEELILH
jgi:hypothetical protein